MHSKIFCSDSMLDLSLSLSLSQDQHPDRADLHASMTAFKTLSVRHTLIRSYHRIQLNLLDLCATVPNNKHECKVSQSFCAFVWFFVCVCVCVCSGSVSGGEEEEGPGVADFNRANQKLGGGWHQNPRPRPSHVSGQGPHAELSGTIRKTWTA